MGIQARMEKDGQFVEKGLVQKDHLCIRMTGKTGEGDVLTR
jgi:hypothetical protein